MSKIQNVPKIRNPLIVAIREQLEHRALWLWYLTDEAEKNGCDPNLFAPMAIRRCGHFQGAGLIRKGKSNTMKGLQKTLFHKIAQWVFEMKVKKVTDDEFIVDFHYCPHVHAWQQAGCTDEQISRLCDWAMCGDRGLADMYDGELILKDTIADGCATCQLHYIKNHLKNTQKP